jgi:proteic killer suppression protein
MWMVYEKKSLAKHFKKIPIEVIKRYEIWKRIVELEGISGLKAIKGFHDESLKGEWSGFRSSRLTIKWRVIYKINNEELEVYVIDVNPHKY